MTGCGIYFILFCLVMCALPAQGQQQPIESSWAIGSFEPSKITSAQVVGLLGDRASDATICDFVFADLVGDGFYRLVVSLDYSGRRFCNELDFFSDTSNEVHTIDVWNVERISDVLVPSGSHWDLRVPEAITDYEGASCLAIVPYFYSLIGGSVAVTNTDHFREYETLLAKLNGPTTVPNACTEVEVDKIERLLGSRTAGFSRAATWMSSSQASLRRKAVRIFQDIGDAASAKALRVLANDKDPTVSSIAATSLVSEK
jgi:hypothetical protein